MTSKNTSKVGQIEKKKNCVAPGCKVERTAPYCYCKKHAFTTRGFSKKDDFFSKIRTS